MHAYKKRRCDIVINETTPRKTPKWHKTYTCNDFIGNRTACKLLYLKLISNKLPMTELKKKSYTVLAWNSNDKKCFIINPWQISFQKLCCNYMHVTRAMSWVLLWWFAWSLRRFLSFIILFVLLVYSHSILWLWQQDVTSWPRYATSCWYHAKSNSYNRL